MSLTELEISGYRSLREIQLPLQQLNVVTGPNGSGKSNLYRSLWLIAQVSEGVFAKTIAREGGFLSVMWAGPRLNHKKPVRMSLGMSSDELNFRMVCGFPIPYPTFFKYDPEIKEELIWAGNKKTKHSTLLERKAGLTWFRDQDGNRVEYLATLTENESVLSQLREPHRFPELFYLREQIRDWRFYHSFRTDDSSPLRSPQISVRTPVLSQDGCDLAAALQTILEIGEAEKLFRMIDSAFPGRQLEIISNQPNLAEKSPRSMELCVGLKTEGCARTLVARELSDGTLKFLCLAAALLSPRPPALIALNEPEASLHPDLISPLARLIVDASELSQVWVSTHSTPLANAIADLSGVHPVELDLIQGETVVKTLP